ncbi:MAG: hypothetical protein GYA62_15385 [Bacteroidales bacterium]|nr:hypothetical protein [Bacteroidales bacterium]
MKQKIILVLVIIAVLGIFSLPFFIKTKIECRSQYGNCSGEVVSGLQQIKNKNYYQTKKEISKFFKTSKMITSYSTQFKLPNIILVNVIVKKPYSAIKDVNTNKIYTIFKDGSIATEVQSTSLPIVSQSGTNINIFAQDLIINLNQMYQINFGKIDNNALVVDITPSLRVIFPLEGDLKVLLGAYRLIYSKVTTEYQGKYSEIDMRYKNPVLR